MFFMAGSIIYGKTAATGILVLISAMMLGEEIFLGASRHDHLRH
jgi:hypothetical protein